MRFLQGNLLESKVEALVNTVNTVGVMGKGIALMFKESFPANFLAYEEACKRKNVKIGRMFVTETEPLRVRIGLLIFQPRNIGGSPPNSNGSSKACKICGVQFRSTRFRSIALPPLGSGNGGLDWHDVRPEIERILGDLEGVDIEIYEPTAKYQNVAKRTGVEELTPARVLIAEMIRRYWVLGIECTYLEVQKLGWFLERTIHSLGVCPSIQL